MMNDPHQSQDSAAIAAELLALSPDYAATPLLDLPRLARRLGVAQLLAKDEGRRMLRSFKSLGGTYAGLRALARAAGSDVATLLARRPSGQPALICASDGNHGLAVALAAQRAGAPARIFLHGGVPAARADRIARLGAEIVWVQGTYDDAVDAAVAAARQGGAILVPDTTEAPHDPVVADVMAGYGVIAAEIRQQMTAAGQAPPTHLFIQAGVGGIAAAMAEGLQGWMAAPATVTVVEPEQAPSVAAGMAAGRAVRIPGSLETAAEMLSCGEASAPALAVLRRHGATVVTVPEAALEAAPAALLEAGGPATTPSGATGLAGALAAAGTLPTESRVLVVITEAALESA
jgi:diaminopropionate ammonia-lyase